MIKNTIYILLLLLALSCREQETSTFVAGGLPYPRYVAAEDSVFYIYQYKDSLATLDSLAAADYGRYFLRAFDEPNLSIAPQQKAVFRFIYEEWGSHPIIINLTEDLVTVKQGVSGGLYPHFDIDRLSKQDQVQLERTEWYFRVGHEKINKPQWRPYIDSLFKRYPRLTDIDSYKKLRQKGEIPIPEKYKYTQKSIPITRKKYEAIVRDITASGFWSMPRQSWCENVPTDGAWFTLEANTAAQYKIVGSPSCPDDYRKFTLACQQIVNLAGLGHQIKLIWDGGTATVDTLDIPEVPLEPIQH